MAYLGQLILLNLLILLCCLPIVTIGAALTAGYACLMSGEDPSTRIITADFFRAFAKNFRSATAVWLAMLAGLVVAAGDFFYAVGVAEPFHPFFAIFGLVLAFVILSCGFWVFPVIARYENGFSGYLRNGFLLAFGRLPRTLYLWAIWLVLIASTFLLDDVLEYFGWLWPLCGVSGLMAVSGRIIREGLDI